MTFSKLQDLPSLQTVNPFLYNILGGPAISTLLNQLGIALPGLGGVVLRGTFVPSGSVGRVQFGAQSIQAGGVNLEQMDIVFNGTMTNTGTSPLDVKWRMSSMVGGTALRVTEGAPVIVPFGASLPVVTPPVKALSNDPAGDVTAKIELINNKTGSVIATVQSAVLGVIGGITNYVLSGSASQGVVGGQQQFYINAVVTNLGNNTEPLYALATLDLPVPYNTGIMVWQNVVVPPGGAKAIQGTLVGQNSYPAGTVVKIRVQVRTVSANGPIMAEGAYDTAYTQVSTTSGALTGGFSF